MPVAAAAGIIAVAAAVTLPRYLARRNGPIELARVENPPASGKNLQDGPRGAMSEGRAPEVLFADSVGEKPMASPAAVAAPVGEAPTSALKATVPEAIPREPALVASAPAGGGGRLGGAMGGAGGGMGARTPTARAGRSPRDSRRRARSGRGRRRRHLPRSAWASRSRRPMPGRAGRPAASAPSPRPGPGGMSLSRYSNGRRTRDSGSTPCPRRGHRSRGSRGRACPMSRTTSAIRRSRVRPASPRGRTIRSPP